MVRWCSWLSRQSNIVSSLKVSSSSLGRINLFARCARSGHSTHLFARGQTSTRRLKRLDGAPGYHVSLTLLAH